MLLEKGHLSDCLSLDLPLGYAPYAVVFFFFLIKIQLIYNVLPISTVQKSDSVIHTHTHIYIFTFFSKYSFPSWFIPGDWL